MPRFPSAVLAALLALPAFAAPPATPTVGSDPYVFRNVAIGGGGFVTGIIFNPTEKGLVYLRTDVGGAYRFDGRTHAWVPLLDWAGQSDWNLYGVESLASDPVDPRRVYIAAGTYTSPRAPNGEILRSADYGATWSRTPVPFKFGANEAGRNNGERLAVDPNDDRILLLGTRQNGLWRSADFGATWTRVAGFPAFDEVLPARVPGGHTYVPQPAGINIILFDRRSGHPGTATPVVYAAASTPNPSLFRSGDGGATWAPVPGQPTGLRPTRAALSSRGVLFVSYGLESGPNAITNGAVWRYDSGSGAWTDITPERPGEGNPFGYGAVAVDPAHPDVVLAGTWNHKQPFDEIFRSTDAGSTWTPLLEKAQWNHSPAPYTKPMTHHWLADLAIDPFDSNHAIFPTGYGIWVTRNLGDADLRRPTIWSFDDQGIEETVPLALISPPAGAHLLSGVGDIDGFRHDDLAVSPPQGRFGTPAFKNTASLAFAWRNPSVIVRSGDTYRNDLVTAGYSLDGGISWRSFVNEPPGTVGKYWRGEGPIAISADGKTVVWSPTEVAASFTTDWGASWFPCLGGSVNLAVAADTVNPARFYAYDTEAGTIIASQDAARSFKSVATGLPVAEGRWGPRPAQIAAVPGHEGAFMFIADDRLFYSANGGRTIIPIPGVEAACFGFGMPKPGFSAPAIFIAGRVGPTEGIFRSDDGFQTWLRINDAAHGFGGIREITGDPRLYGRVYLGTSGRGIIYGDRAP